MTAEADRPRFSPAKLALQITGFVIGVAMLVWIVQRAAAEGDLDRLRNADPWLVAALLGTTLVSSFFNGATFWCTIRPVKRCGFWDFQFLNVFSNMLNYAPVRLGAVARIMFHWKIDRLGLKQIAAWFMVVAAVLLAGTGACFIASIMRERIDLAWFGLVIGQLVVSVVLIRLLLGSRLVGRHAGGTNVIALDPTTLGAAYGLRVLDIAAFTARMAIAARILEIELTGPQLVTLAMVALGTSVLPIPRAGVREFCVAMVATRLDIAATDVDLNLNQLALVESAGEALVYIPLGALLTFWYRHRWAHRQVDDPNDGAPDPAR